MTSLTSQKTVYASYLLVIASSILMPDVVFGLIIELMHVLLEFAHLLFEFIESSLDHVVEHIFETDVHETQVIVFYMIVTMAFGGLYFICRAMPSAFRKFKEHLISTWLDFKSCFTSTWASLSLINKIKTIVLLNIALTCFFLFGF